MSGEREEREAGREKGRERKGGREGGRIMGIGLRVWGNEKWTGGMGE